MGFQDKNIWLQSKRPTELQLAYDWAKSVVSKKVKPETVTQYKRYYSKYAIIDPGTQKAKLDIRDINNLSKKSTRSFHRSSFRYCAAIEILILIHTAPNKAISLFRKVQRINQDAKENQLKYKTGVHQDNKQKNSSKRISVAGLIKDWLAQLVELSSASIYADQIRIMCLTGCRPSEFSNQLPGELNRGIKVEVGLEYITFTIPGSKCDAARKSGQVSRILTFPKNHPLATGLKTGFYFAESKPIQDAVRNFGKKVKRKDNKAKQKISAYTIRHQIASDLKNSNIDRDDISLALGHQSADTKSTYGSTTFGINKSLLVSVTATAPVRPSKKASNDYLYNLKSKPAFKVKT